MDKKATRVPVALTTRTQKYYLPSQAAALLSVSRSRVTQFIRAGALIAVTIDGRPWIDGESLGDLARARQADRVRAANIADQKRRGIR
jgi:hypothetical protein